MIPFSVTRNPNFVGREFESLRLKQALDSHESSIIVVYGRRRVGKTELVEQTCIGRKILKFEGLEHQSVNKQKQAFLDQLAIYCQDPTVAKIRCQTWREVFVLLAKYVSTDSWVIYLEELQWMANGRVDLISDLKFAWDNYFRTNPKLKLILCGSSTSFMVKKVVLSRALHNRSLHELPVRPFSLRDTYRFLGHSYSKRSVLDAYLTLGGIPEYLKYIKKHSSPFLAILEESFVPGGFLVSEFDKVFVSTLGRENRYKAIVQHLAAVGYASRGDLAKFLGMEDGGSLTTLLQDLSTAGFIASQSPLQLCGVRGASSRQYWIKDPYIHFYSRFIKDELDAIRSGDFISKKHQALDTRLYQQFLGFSFERFCFDNHTLIAKALGFDAVRYRYGSLRVSKSASSRGFQVDLIFERNDKVATICEIKYGDAVAGLEVADEFQRKLELIKLKRSFTINKVLISASGASDNLIKSGYFDRILTLEELFAVGS